MMQTLWRRINRRRKLRGFSGQALMLVRRDNTGVLMKFKAYEAKGFRWNTVTTVDTRRPYLAKWRLTRENAALSPLLSDADHHDDPVVAMPMWRQPAWARWLRILVTVLIWYLLGMTFAALGADGETAGALTTLLYPLVLWFTPRLGPVEVRSLEQLPLNSRNVAEYAALRLKGAHPEALEAQPHRERVLARIADIRADYGALKLDVLYRIDHPALFDGAASETSRFLAALIRAEDLSEEVPLDELERLASTLEVTFAVAKANAEAVGIQHLPRDKRDDARRAGKVARLARESTNDGERRAARSQLNRILESMALYYMPAPDEVLAIEAPRR